MTDVSAMVAKLEREAVAFEYAANGAHLAAVVPKKDALALAAFLREVAAVVTDLQKVASEVPK